MASRKWQTDVLSGMCICVCVCVLMPTHCTITCCGFHAKWIDGVKCGLFSNHAPFGQTTLLVGWVVYLYSVREKVEFRVTVIVTVCVVLLCCVGWWWKEGRRWNPVPTHSLLFSKSTKGAPGLTSPSDGRIAINSIICLLNIRTAEGFGI